MPQPEMDAWALGVMAYELLTGGPAFQVLVDGPQQVRPPASRLVPTHRHIPEFPGLLYRAVVMNIVPHCRSVHIILLKLKWTDLNLNFQCLKFKFACMQIIAQLKGNAELPWEGERANPETLRKLRTLRRPVMALLERDPSLRPSLMRFCDQCDDIFGTRTLKG